MNIYLIRSSELKPHHFFSFHDLIRQYPGPVQYIVHEKPPEVSDEEKRDEPWEQDRLNQRDKAVMTDSGPIIDSVSVTVPWSSIFDRCDQARSRHNIPGSEPVVLLTDHANELNWFTGADPSGKPNMFVHTGLWDLYMSEDFRHPVVYHLASIPLQMLMFGTFENLVRHTHQEPRGCMNDFCQDKTQIRLKLRTGDICQECRQIIRDGKTDPQVVSQVFRIFEGIRSQMLFRASFSVNQVPSRLTIDWDKRQVYLSDLGNLLIPLNPMDKTVYHLFLKHPDGIAFAAMPNHRQEMLTLYRHYSDTPSIATMNGRIDDLCANRNDCLSQAISRIRRKFEEALPEEMASLYIIGGGAGRKRRILVGRELVSITSVNP